MGAAVRELVVFILNGLRLALPLQCVERVVAAARPEPLPGAPSFILGVIDLQGELVAVFDMRARIGLPIRALQPSDRFLIVAVPGHRLALVADEVEGVVQPREEQPVAALLPGVEEQILQALGRCEEGIVLIEDPRKFFSPLESRQLAQALETQP